MHAHSHAHGDDRQVASHAPASFGRAFAIGIALAFAFSARLGLLGQHEAERVARHFETVGLPTHPAGIDGGLPGADGLMELMAQDKKVRRGKLSLILARGIGASFVAEDIEPAQVRAFLAEKLARS